MESHTWPPGHTWPSLCTVLRRLKICDVLKQYRATEILNLGSWKMFGWKCCSVLSLPLFRRSKHAVAERRLRLWSKWQLLGARFLWNQRTDSIWKKWLMAVLISESTSKSVSRSGGANVMQADLDWCIYALWSGCSCKTILYYKMFTSFIDNCKHFMSQRQVYR